MLLDIHCKTGKIQVTEEGMLRVQAPFNKTVWQVPCSAITGFVTHPGSLGSLNVTIHSMQESYQAETVTHKNFAKLQALFPQAHTGTEWYHDPTKRTHVEIYTDQKKMQREVEAAGQFGWVPQTSAGVGSHVNVGRTITKAALTGGLGLMTGASRSKDKITITFVRAQDWLDQHR